MTILKHGFWAAAVYWGSVLLGLELFCFGTEQNLARRSFGWHLQFSYSKIQTANKKYSNKMTF